MALHISLMLTLLSADGSNVSVQEAKQILQTELSKQRDNWDEAIRLFKYLHNSRREELRKVEARDVTSILKLFPALEHVVLVNMLRTFSLS